MKVKFDKDKDQHDTLAVLAENKDVFVLTKDPKDNKIIPNKIDDKEAEEERLAKDEGWSNC